VTIMRKHFSVEGLHEGVLSLKYHGPMPQNDREAKAISVVKWQIVVEALEKNPRLVLLLGGPRTCGFCMRHFANNCVGCPVSRRTGKSHCRHTPTASFIAATERRIGTDPVKSGRAVLRFAETTEVD
jgi:hypothetical protein